MATLCFPPFLFFSNVSPICSAFRCAKLRVRSGRSALSFRLDLLSSPPPETYDGGTRGGNAGIVAVVATAAEAAVPAAEEGNGKNDEDEDEVAA